jgi:Lipopolysaccharide-assembly
MILKINNGFISKIKVAGVISFCLLSIAFFFQCCNIYKFKDVNIEPEVKTVKVDAIINKARYVNPRLSPQLTDKLRQKIVGQTRLSPTNGEAHYEITGEITDYYVSTGSISQQQTTGSQLNVSVHITLFKRLDNKSKEFTVTRNFPYAATKTLQAAESELNTEIIRNLTDEIFNQIFSDW